MSDRQRWTDQMAGARMQVDQQFNDRILDSEFTNQQWGLIMTAVEFDIDNPNNPEEAELVADTEKVPQILPELEKIPQGGPGGGGSGGSRSGGGLVDRLRGLFGGGDSGGVDQQRLDAATALVEEYTVELQEFLEDHGRWEAVCESATNASEPNQSDA